MKMPRFTFAEIAATLPFIQANGVVMPYNQTKENIHKKKFPPINVALIHLPLYDQSDGVQRGHFSC